MEHEGDNYTKGTGGLGNNGTSEDCPNYSILEIGQNTEKSPGDLRRLAVTQTPVENHQRQVMGKISRRKIMIIIFRNNIDKQYCYSISAKRSTSMNLPDGRYPA